MKQNQFVQQQAHLTEKDLYLRKAHFEDDVESVNSTCLLCKKGKAKKIIKCSMNWCYAFKTKIVFKEKDSVDESSVK